VVDVTTMLKKGGHLGPMMTVGNGEVMQGRWRGSSFSQEGCSADQLLEVDGCGPGPTLFM
jgi:hypothetical protein